MYVYISTFNDSPDYKYDDIMFKNYYKDFKDLGWHCIKMCDLVNISLEQYFLDNNITPKAIYFCFVNTLIENNWKYISGLNCVKCAFMDDLHQNSGRTRNFRFKLIKNFDCIFMTYAYCYSKFFPDILSDKIYWLPHCVISSIKIEFNPNPKHSILLSGLVEKRIYPMRQQMFNLRNKYAIDILEHPTYKYDKHNIIGAKYYEYLNGYLCCFTCCSNSDTPYIVQKFFEICYAGSLLFCYDKYVTKELEMLGFINGVNYIRCDETNMEEQIKYILDENNLPQINKIRANGYALVTQNHTSQSRAKFVSQLMDTITRQEIIPPLPLPDNMDSTD
jgi:hypothetical protein